MKNLYVTFEDKPALKTCRKNCSEGLPPTPSQVFFRRGTYPLLLHMGGSPDIPPSLRLDPTPLLSFGNRHYQFSPAIIPRETLS